jgi:thiamine-monophosphate kinase
MMRPLSDFAAMSAIPEFGLITLMVRGDTSMTWLNRVYRGLARAARRFEVSIVGGETSSTSGPAAITVAVIGQVEKKRWVSRHGGKPGDQLFVTGRLGRSITGKHLRFIPRIEESRWLTANFPIHAMMDLSDGMGADLPRLARASGVGFEIDETALPRARGATVKNAITDGEDYELLFAISARESEKLRRRWAAKFPRLQLTRIGSLTKPRSGRRPQFKSGYVHFR